MGVRWVATWGSVTSGKWEVTSDQTRKGETGLLRKTSGKRGDTIGAKENPAGLNLRGVVIGLD